MSHIFLSYCAEDRERVRPLVALLGEVGPVWWDQSIRHGQNWEKAVEKAVEKASCVVVAWTRESVESDWVRSEATDARDRSILVPVLLDDVKPPLTFRHIQTAQLQGWDGDPRHPQAQALKAAVADLVAGRSTSSLAAPPPGLRAPAPPPPSAAPPSRRRSPWLRTPGARVALAAVGAVIVVTAVLGGYLRERRSSRLVVRADVTPAPVGSSAPPATPVAPTPPPTAVPLPKTVVPSLKTAVPSTTAAPLLTAADPPPTTAVPPPTTALPSPTVVPSPTPALPSLTTLPEAPHAQILVRDIRNDSPLEAVEQQRFHYAVSETGVIFSGARRQKDGPISIGVATTRQGGTRRLRQTELANLVALLTTLAHDHELDLLRVDFEDVDALSVAKADIVKDAKELLARWRASGVRPGKAAVDITRIASGP